MKPTSRSHVLLIIFGIIFFITGSLGKSVSASQRAQSDCPIDYIWRQIYSGDFVILYTVSQISLAEEINQKYLPQIKNEFDQYSKAFSTNIQTPITIRIYPSVTEYYCLNALAPIINEEVFHTHIGTREIALIANVVNQNPMTWDSRAMNALRHEIAVLFGEEISAGDAPPGLLQGLGGYFELPEEVFIERYDAAGHINQPDRGWQRLWEEDIPVSNSLVMLQQVSVVAYLIDVFGWDHFINFLEGVSEYQGYRQSLIEVYGVNLQDLQNHWVQYFPVYVNGRWQANVIHSYDLSQFHILISGGAYADAAEKLRNALPLIELFGSQQQILEANGLLEQAEMGVRAANLALESRQAILALDYGIAYSKAEQALLLYRGLGDTRRISEVQIYLDISAEVLSLRQELNQLSGVGTPFDPIRTQKIVSIGRRLNELGDSEGANQVQIALLLLGAGRDLFVKVITVIGLLVSVFLIWRRIGYASKHVSSEGNLL